MLLLKTKIVSLLIVASLFLTACGGVSQDTVNTVKTTTAVADELAGDTVLWVNEDGTDCDVGDLAEGDKDCSKKIKKKNKVANGIDVKQAQATIGKVNKAKSTYKDTKKKIGKVQKVFKSSSSTSKSKKRRR